MEESYQITDYLEEKHVLIPMQGSMELRLRPTIIIEQGKNVMVGVMSRYKMFLTEGLYKRAKSPMGL